jgi:hypothetical protein
VRCLGRGSIYGPGYIRNNLGHFCCALITTSTSTSTRCAMGTHDTRSTKHGGGAAAAPLAAPSSHSHHGARANEKEKEKGKGARASSTEHRTPRFGLALDRPAPGFLSGIGHGGFGTLDPHNPLFAATSRGTWSGVSHSKQIANSK